jgi:group I intron endonuclease
MKRPTFLHKAGVYRIRNLENGKSYVGSSVRLKVRFREHANKLNNQTHPCRYLRSSWRKYQPSSFVFEVLTYCEPTHAVWLEQRFIDGLRPEYNTCQIAGSTLGTRRTEEAKAKMRAAKVGFVPSPEHLANMRKAAEARRGVKRPPRSAEWNRKQSEAQKGSTRNFTEEHRANLAKSQIGNTRWLGKKHTAETREKMAQAQAGKGRLTDTEIRDIRGWLELGVTQMPLASCYGVSRRLIGMIGARKAYAWVTEHPN